MPEREIWIASASVLVPRPLAPTVCSMPAVLGRLDQQLEDLRREGRAAPDHRPGAERMAADLLLVDARGVGGMGDVDRDGEVGPHLEGRGAGAEEADLLLDRGDRGEAGRGASRARGSGAAPRARRRRRAGCPSTARPAGRRRAGPARRRSRPGRRPGPARSPRRGRRRRCRCGAPSARPPSSAARASSRWIGLRPTTPGTRPSLPRTSTRWPTRICGSQPPIGLK